MNALFQFKDTGGLLLLLAVVSAVLAAVWKLRLKKINLRFRNYTNQDIMAVLSVTALYAAVSLYRLGSTVFPVTTWQPSTAGQDVVFELTGDTRFDRLVLLYGEGDNNALEAGYQIGLSGLAVYGSQDQSQWDLIWSPDAGQIYEYMMMECNLDYRYLRLSSVDPHNTITEFAVKAAGKDEYLPLAVAEDAYADSRYPAVLMIDEQDKLLIDPLFTDEAYFDEVYHVRNAWEIANGQYMYATVHPLLGTNIMALFIRLFGLSPFVWRLPGALCGIFMIPLFYAIVHLLFSSTYISFFASCFLAGDFMHLTTSRIGTLEPFSMITILWMVLEMLKYCHMDHFEEPFDRQLKQLFKAGLAMSVAIAVKWTACYSAVGLALLLFTRFFLWYRTWKASRGHTGPYARSVQKQFPAMFWKTAAWCFVFFIFLPIAVYWLAYLPDHISRSGWSIGTVWEQTLYMYRYHSTLEATHPFQSSWYHWVLDLRPIWYYFHTSPDEITYSISCFSHPLLAWGGLFCFLMTVSGWIGEKDVRAWEILVLILTAILPWALLVGRCTFAYHYYPTSVFLVLAIAWAVNMVLEESPGWKLFFHAVLVVYFLIFLLYLPATAGHGAPLPWIRALELLSGWRFG
ncbi:MAG: glycosyltransferase family 39 protein [Solobacterium sp.]|nr:glycosyltransferase family 39 protein [Solobacterium sp.]